MNMKNKGKKGIIALSVLWTIIIGVLVCVYIIGGITGAYAWNFAIFIAAPIGVILSISCFVILLVRVIKRNPSKQQVIFQITFLLLAFPILILFGIVLIPYPASIEESKTLVIDNPVGSDAVLFGGADYKTHSIWPSERFAYDILVEPYENHSTNLNDYGIYGRDIHSPIEGTVIYAHDGEEDIIPNSEEFTSSVGNCIYIKIKNMNTYLILAHLKKDSVCVKAGDRIPKGKILGKVGNSGTTSEPHLHIQHQKENPMNTLYPTCAQGLPIVFK